MGLFDKLFQPYTAKPKPQEVAPDVKDVPPMTCHAGKVLNADCIKWTVHCYLIDTDYNKVIYDNYNSFDSEAAAREMYYMALKENNRRGACICRCDYWGEYQGRDFQQALDEIKSRLAEDYSNSLKLLQSRQSDQQVRAADKINARYLDLKQEHKNLLEEYGKYVSEVKQAAANILQILQSDEIYTEREAERLKQELARAGLPETAPDALRLMAYYLAPLLKE
jgi:hypothetical protein